MAASPPGHMLEQRNTKKRLSANRLPADQYAVGRAVNQATRQIGSLLDAAVTVLTPGQGPLTHGVARNVHLPFWCQRQQSQ